MLRKSPPEQISQSPGLASMKQQPYNTRPAGVQLLPQETIKHVDDRPLLSDADELLHHCLDQASIAEQNSPRSPCTRPYKDELAMLCDVVIGFEREQQAVYDKNSQPEGGPTNSPIGGVLEKAVGYIHYLQEQQNILEQESEALRAKLALWTGEDEILCRWRSGA